MADLSNVPSRRYKIFNNKKEAIKIPASHVLKHPTFEEHFTRTSHSNTRRLESGRCSCIIDIVTVFLRDGRFYNLHTGQCRCIFADDIPKFAKRMRPADVLCLKLMYEAPVTPEADGTPDDPQLSNHESLRQDLDQLVMSLAD
ncbi:uncharacterized protein LW94_1070 [Fusarium fujikuroi]|nr:uncharacterized protein LW94_1070 [Fusarium fujikuroi]